MNEKGSKPDKPGPSEEQSGYGHLVSLCERGMLYEAEEWLGPGRVATQPPEARKCPLHQAVKSGFHSLVKLLLQHDCSEEQKLRALERAVTDGNPDICKLLVEAGAPVRRLCGDDLYVHGTVSRPLIECLLDHGLDLAKGNVLAHMFVERRMKPLLGIFLQNRDRFPELEEQAAMALGEFIRKRDKKWISLMVWAKTDPLLSVPHLSGIFSCEEEEEDCWKNSALECAVQSDDIDILRMLKVKLTAEQATRLLYSAWIWKGPDAPIMERLLAAGAEVNSYTPEGGSLLHKAIRVFAYRRSILRGLRPSPQEDVETISWLIQEGAKWRPPEERRWENSLRRDLYRQQDELVVEIIRLLHAGKCCDPAFLKEFVDKPKMRRWIRTFDRKLFRALGF